jgi:hypothetical protein
MQEAMWRFSLLALVLPACHLADPGQIQRTCEDLPIGCDQSSSDDTAAPVDVDEDGYTSDIDCNDEDPDVHPDADEICDEIDNDCDQAIDEEDDSLIDGFSLYLDQDGDGYGLMDSQVSVCEESSGFVDNDEDCNDDDADIFPGATEICDGVDSDCDGVEASGILSTNGENYDSISAALNAAPTGGRITFCDGEWVESVAIYDSVSLVSLNGSANTVLMAEDERSLVEVFGGDVTLEGLTLTGGEGSDSANWGPAGGAIYIQDGSLSLSDIVMRENSAVIGGALFIDQGVESVTIEDSVIDSNTGSQYCGAIFNYSTLSISNTTISNNSSYWCGGLGSYGGVVHISGGAITDNEADYDGAGVWALVSSLTLSGVDISGNFASNDGGGIYFDEGSLTCEGATSIRGNAASSEGGGLYIRVAVVSGCSITGNSAIYGGGIAFSSGESFLSDSQVQENTAISWGGGAYVEGALAHFDNVSLDSNESTYGAGLYIISDGEVELEGGSVAGNSAVNLGGGVRLASGSVTANNTDFGDGEQDNSPDDLAISGPGGEYSGLGAGSSFTCKVNESETECDL